MCVSGMSSIPTSGNRTRATTAAAVRAQAGGRSGGWGSIKVRVTIGDTLWNTSLFPHRESGGFMLPLKADVRRKEGLSEGNLVSGSIEI